MSRRPNPRLVKIHHTYTVDEAARRLGVHKNTVRAWFKRGLPTIDDRRPTLVHGRDLQVFLETQRKGAKQSCPPAHIYCVRCRSPKLPAGGMVDYCPITATSGNLRGICPDCDTLIHRRVSLPKLAMVTRGLEVTVLQEESRIGGNASPSVNCDFNRKGKTDEDA